MTVVDASPVVDVLMREPSAARARVEGLISDDQPLHAPDILVFEVISALRRAVFDRRLTANGGERAMRMLGKLPITLHPSLPLRHVAWRLRENFSAGDALFVALAQALEAPLATKDGRLVAAARSHTEVTVLDLT